MHLMCRRVVVAVWLAVWGSALLAGCAARESPDGECSETVLCEPDSVCRSGRCVDATRVPLDVRTSSAGTSASITVHEPSGVRCAGGACGGLDYGTSVVLRASDVPGYRFAGWSGGALCTGTELELVIERLTDDALCVANYVRRLHVGGFVLGAPEGPASRIEVYADHPAARCEGGGCEVDEGTPVRLVAPERWGERFSHWAGEGCSGSEPVLDVMPEVDNIVCAAVYIPRLTVSARATGTPAAIIVSSDTPGAVCEIGSCLIDRGGSAVLHAPTVPGMRFAGWSGTAGCSGVSQRLVIDDLREMQHCQASYVQRVRVSGVTTGAASAPPVAATSSDASASCTIDGCEIDVGGSLTLRASSVAGHRFAGWSGRGCGPSSSPAIKLSGVTSDIVCVAEYKLGIAVIGAVLDAPGEVIASSPTPGAVCAPGGCVLTAGGSATLTAPTIPGQRFLGWEGDPGCAGAATSIQFAHVTQSRTCYARYAPRFVVSGAAEPIEGGSVRASAPSAGATCAGSMCTVDGGEVVLEALPAQSYRFAGWSGGGTCGGTSPILRLAAVAGNVHCRATFVRHLTVLGVSAPTQGGSIELLAGPDAQCERLGCTLPAGATVTLIARSQPDYHFTGWSGCATETSPMLVLRSVVDDTVCQANFARPRFTVSASAAPPGSGSVAVASSTPGAQCEDARCSVELGGRMTLTAMAAPGHRFIGWSGCALSTDVTLTLSDLASDGSCQANFERLRRQISVSVSSVQPSLGTARVTAPGGLCTTTHCSVDEGTPVTLIATPLAPTTPFIGWTGGGCPAGNLGQTIVEARAPLSCAAIFAAPPQPDAGVPARPLDLPVLRAPGVDGGTRRRPR